MARNLAAEVQEAAVSRTTAVSCLAMLGTQIGTQIDIDGVRARQVAISATLALSELVKLSNDFGLDAQYVHRDWAWLQQALATRPLILILKNGNTIVAVSMGRADAQEIVISDPLHRAGALTVLPRETIERAWDGEVITIAPRVIGIAEEDLPTKRPAEGNSRSSKTQHLGRLLAIIVLCFGVVSLVTALVTFPTAQKTTVIQQNHPPAFVVPSLPTPPNPIERGHAAAADQASKGTSATDPFLAVVFGTMAAETVSHALEGPLLPQPGINEAPVVAAVSVAPEPKSQIPGETVQAPGADQESNQTSTANLVGYPVLGSVAAEMISRPAEAPTLPQLGVKEASIAAISVAPEPTTQTPVAISTAIWSGNVGDAALVLDPGAPPQSAGPLSEPSPSATLQQKYDGPGRGKLSTTEIDTLVSRGDERLLASDVTAARLFYQRAAEAGDAQAALKLGMTFDPVFLKSANLLRARGDQAKALSWYSRARDLGSADAEKLLNGLNSRVADH